MILDLGEIYLTLIRTAVTAENEGGLKLPIGDIVTEALNNMELLTVKAVESVLKKHIKSANSALKQSPMTKNEDKEVADEEMGDWIMRLFEGREKLRVCGCLSEKIHSQRHTQIIANLREVGKGKEEDSRNHRAVG